MCGQHVRMEERQRERETLSMANIFFSIKSSAIDL